MNEPGTPLPGANVPADAARFATVPVPVRIPPLTSAPPFNAPLFTVMPAVLVRRPETEPPAPLLKAPAFDTVPIHVAPLSMMPVLETTLPVQMPRLMMRAALLAMLPLHVPVVPL